ncbi:MAG: AAA family ATPase [Actinomycetota bacterium]
MISLDGYSITERLATSGAVVICRGRRLGDDAPIIAKVLDLEFPSPFELARIRHEYEILRSFQHPNVITVHALERVGNTLAIIMEDFGGVPLKSVIADHRLGLAARLDIARRVVDVVGTIHEKLIVHKDINPSNILVNLEHGQLKIIDFSIASRLSQETMQLPDAHSLEGTLAYIAPEQTGRMNRPIDYRCDFYGLGITLYELFLGRPPFDARDAVELVHLHLASVPRPLHELDPAIPPALSRIVAKLMEKDAENRYLSTVGIARDLAECLEAGEDFMPGRFDPPTRFIVPSRLYGRDEEIGRLIRAYQRVRAGQSAVVLVAGYSGIGKSALINEIHRPIAETMAFFVSGKYDQYRRNIPYFALIQALRELLQQVLAQPAARIEALKERILEALEGNGRIVVDVLPELAHIVGSQPEVPELAPQEAQNRFNYTFMNFIQAFAGADSPLVIFLDDLQWADASSISLIEMLMLGGGCHHLLLLGAYRSNEVDGAHPLMLAVGHMRKAGAPIDEMALERLAPEAVRAIVTDTVRRPATEVEALADLISRKTDGNPFFIGQVLKDLHGSGLIAFDARLGQWTWDIDRIHSVGICENVADLMAAKLRELPDETRLLLKLAACIGNRFTLQDLSVVREHSWEEVAAGILPALRMELVTPLDREYRFYGGEQTARSGDFNVRYTFVHDRVQQTAYDLLDEGERRQTHVKAGRLLLESVAEDELDDKVFDIVSHFNQAGDLVPSELRPRLARLNLTAAIKAKGSIAYEPALRYVTAAREFLADVPDRDTLFQILKEQAECEYVNGNADKAKDLYRKALDAAGGDDERALVYEKMVHFHTNTGNFRLAYDTGREALRLFGVSLPANFVPPLFLADLARVKWKLRGRRIEDLADLPLCRDERLKTAMRLIGALLKAAYQVRPELCVACATKAVNISLSHGTMEDNAVAFVVFGGIFVGGVMGNRRDGYEFGKLALAMNARFNNQKLAAEINFVSAYFTNFWIEPAENTEKFYRAAYDEGLRTGDFFHLSCAACTLVESQFIRGVRLDEVRNAAEAYLAFMGRIKAYESAGAITAVLRTIANLQGRTASPQSFDGDGFDEAAFVHTVEAFTSKHFAHFYFVDKMLALYLWGRHEDALKVARISESYLKYSLAMLHTAEHHFLHALILCAAFRRGRDTAHLRKARKILKKLDGWAGLNPANFQHKAMLVRAEIASCLGEAMAAVENYAGAIRSAAAHGFVQVHALANELAGKFYAARKIDMAASGHFRAAHHGYMLWGAPAIAERLADEYPFLSIREPDATKTVASVTQTLAPHEPGTTRAATSTQSRLDIETVIKATRALSGEIKLPTLLKKLVAIMIENAGAERGAFVRLDQDRLLVEAMGAGGEDRIAILDGTPLDPAELPLSVIQYVTRVGESVVLDDARSDQRFWNDPYIRRSAVKSVLCSPIIHHGQVIGLIYLENNLASAAFTAQRLAMLNVLSGQAAVSLENSILYGQMEDRVKERTRELLAVTEQLKAASEAKSEFLATMSHEIRTPMNGILGMARLVQESHLDTTAREQMEMLTSSAEALLTILNDILDFSKLEAGKIEFEAVPFNLHRLLDAVVTLLKSRADEKGITLVTRNDPYLPSWLTGDPGRLRQVLLNLIGNAVKFTERGGVTVQAAVRPGTDGRVGIEFSIIDTGIGIDEEGRKRLFGSFAQVDASISRRFGGTGLGLAICKRLIEGQGGEIGVDSEPGKGSRFWFRLEFAPTEAPANADAAPVAVRLPKLRILLAEDNPVNQKVALGLLSKGEHAVTVVGNGREAVDAVAGGSFDVVLMDMQMPVMDGLTAAREIRRMPAPSGSVPMIALTANAMRGDIERCHAAGMNAHVTKPIDPLVLNEAIARVLQNDGAPAEAVAAAEDDIMIQMAAHLGADVLAELADMFLSAGLKDYDELTSLRQNGDLADIRHYAHDLKGMAGYVGATNLGNLVAAIEEAAKEGNDFETRALLDDLPGVWNAAVAQLEKVKATA